MYARTFSGLSDAAMASHSTNPGKAASNSAASRDDPRLRPPTFDRPRVPRITRCRLASRLSISSVATAFLIAVSP